MPETTTTPTTTTTTNTTQTTQTHGKGRTRPRPPRPADAPAPHPDRLPSPAALRLLPAAQAQHRRLLAAATTTTTHSTTLATTTSDNNTTPPPPRYPAALDPASLQRIDLAGPNPAKAHADLHRRLRRHAPAHVRRAPFHAGARWTQASLEAPLAAPPARHAQVLTADAAKARFLHLAPAKNVYGTMYHVREPETVALDMAYPDFRQCAETWRLQRLAHFECDLPAALSRALDWAWLRALLRAHAFGPVLGAALAAGMRGGVLPARYRTHDRFLAQVAGRRRVLLVAPAATLAGLYPYPVHHPYDGYAMVDFDAVEPDRWPKFAGCAAGEGGPEEGGGRAAVAVLEPGDLLFVPAFWWCHVQELDAGGVAVEVAVGRGARVLPEPAAEVALARLVEERVADAESVQDARHWLGLIGREEEMDWIDPSTLQGYRRVRFCQMLRDEIEHNLGPGSVRGFLDKVCDRRLHPTAWLNKDFREPLYLLDRPVRLEDTRTEQEKAFPELFRRKLARDGWTVPQHVSTVPIPGYNMPANADYRTYGLEGGAE